MKSIKLIINIIEYSGENLKQQVFNLKPKKFLFIIYKNVAIKIFEDNESRRTFLTNEISNKNVGIPMYYNTDIFKIDTCNIYKYPLFIDTFDPIKTIRYKVSKKFTCVSTIYTLNESDIYSTLFKYRTIISKGIVKLYIE